MCLLLFVRAIQTGENVSTSIRFRPRQGERKREGSSAQRMQLIVQSWAKRIQGLFTRYLPHLAVFALAILVFSSGQFSFPVEYQLPLRATPTTAPSLGLRGFSLPSSGRGGARGEAFEASVPETPTTPVRPVNSVRSLTLNSLFQAPVVHTTIPERLRREVITYIVQQGDTTSAIALQFGLEAETVMWANGSLAQNPDLLRPGQELIILPIDGVYHTVVKGDTLEQIAKKYEADVEHIVQCPYNDMDPEDPQVVLGQKIIVPGGIKPYIPRHVSAYNGPIPENAERGTGIFSWPVTGRLTDRFGFKTFSGRWHGGLDIAGPAGSPVYAADSGFVTFAGWTKSGYGNLIVIDHRNGFETRYAHLNACYVSAGESVAKGMPIGERGNTGNSTGPHLHFEIRYKGVRKNPELYLP